MPAVGDQHRGGPPSTMMPSTAGFVSGNPFEEPQRRMSEYTAREIATLQARLDKKLGPEYISSRPGASGQRVHYLSSDKCISLANEVFGFNGWSSSIQNIQIDFVEESQHTGKISLGLSVIVRVTLKDGTFHEDIGYGHIENCKGKAAAFEKAKKEGTTDALKRALRNFGNVLGNCIYDKDYVSRVTKVKAVQTKWDVDNLHRHPDFAPIKKEPAPQKQPSEDDDLPPRPLNVGKRESNDNTPAYDGDGEFGSDLFDEADFSVAETGNPDEITLGPVSSRQQPPPNNQNAQPGPVGNTSRPPPPNPAVVTPSKPERSCAPAAAPRPSAPSAYNGPNHMTQEQRRPGPAGSGPGPQDKSANMAQPQSRPNQGTTSAAGGQPHVTGVDGKPQPMLPPNSTPSVDAQRQPGSNSAAFFSARAVDMIRDNPQSGPSAAPQFDPHTESPSIRKTAGVDHTKSIPISKPMLAGVSPASNNTRDFINPSSDMHRKIGTPGGGASGIGSPLNRSQTTSSYRPLTRPNIDSRGMGMGTGTGAGMGNPAAPLPNRANFAPQNTNTNANGKRPPLSDVTNGASVSGAPAGVGAGTSGPAFNTGPNDLKKPRFNEAMSNPAQQPYQHQQQQQQPPHQR